MAHTGRMKPVAQFRLVLVTAPNLRTARKLAKAALAARLAACANLVPKIESHYWWQGQLESATEVLILFKTRRHHLKALETLVLRAHPYTTPEFLVLSVGAGNQSYLGWLAKNS
jgi:periplasmic divalent cation tolerance protein